MARHAQPKILGTTTAVLAVILALGAFIGWLATLDGAVTPPKPPPISAPAHPHPAPHRPSQRQHKPSVERYTVQHGDSLWTIAVQHYHDGLKWHQLYRVNMKIIGNNPDRIFPGQTLTLIGGP